MRVQYFLIAFQLWIIKYQLLVTWFMTHSHLGLDSCLACVWQKVVPPKLTRRSFHRAHWVPQGGGRVQGWESECWGGVGDSLIWIYKSYQISISFFVIDVKFISKSLQCFFAGIFIVFRCTSSHNLINMTHPTFPFFKFIFFKSPSSYTSKFPIY